VPQERNHMEAQQVLHHHRAVRLKALMLNLVTAHQREQPVLHQPQHKGHQEAALQLVQCHLLQVVHKGHQGVVPADNHIPSHQQDLLAELQALQQVTLLHKKLQGLIRNRPVVHIRHKTGNLNSIQSLLIADLITIPALSHTDHQAILSLNQVVSIPGLSQANHQAELIMHPADKVLQEIADHTAHLTGQVVKVTHHLQGRQAAKAILHLHDQVTVEVTHHLHDQVEAEVVGQWDAPVVVVADHQEVAEGHLVVVADHQVVVEEGNTTSVE